MGIATSNNGKLELNYDMFEKNTFDTSKEPKDFREVLLKVVDNTSKIYDDEGNEVPSEFWAAAPRTAEVRLLVHDNKEMHIGIKASEFFDEEGNIKEDYIDDRIYFVKEDKEGE